MIPTFRTSDPVSAADVEETAVEKTPHIILVGLPGAGKTTVGRAVAEATGRRFLDFDAEIERREHSTVPEIFGSKGEPHFRKLERLLTEDLQKTGNMILAPGGGWIANPGCLELLRPPATLIYLKVRPEAAMSRMGADAVNRPLLMRPDPLGELRKLLEIRENLYLKADHTVSTNMMSFGQVVDRIVALARG